MKKWITLVAVLFAGPRRALMRHLSFNLGVLLLASVAFAQPVTLVLDGKSTTLEGFVQQELLYVALPGLLQALGEGARPVKIDLVAQLITLTKGDGQKQVSVSMQTKNGQLYVSALEAARGLGFEASFKDNTLTLSRPSSVSSGAPPPQADALYPQGFEASRFEGVAKAIYDELESSSKTSPNLEALLNLAGVPVFGTQTHPADADQLEVYQALHHPFATVFELFTLRAGFQYRLFTPLKDFFSGLSDRAVLRTKPEPDRAPALVATLFGGPPSRSQVVFALVGAMGRERAKRGISLSHKPDPFWGDDALDPVQLRLLDAVLTTGPGPEFQALHRSSAAANNPSMFGPGSDPTGLLALSKRPNQLRYQRRAQAGGEVLVIQEMASDLAEKAVKEIVKQAYPDAKDWLDNEVQDIMGIPLVLPISPELLESVLKNDTAGTSKIWGGLLKKAGIETAKEGARLMLCGSITLYGYETNFEADPLVIHHRTDGEGEGKSLSKLKVKINFKDDYRNKVFNSFVQFAAGLAIKDAPKNAAELLERLGCKIPEAGPGKDKGVEWELTGDLPDHTEGADVQFADKTTNAAGEAKAQLRAVDEHTPKAFRLGSKRTTGVLFVRLLDLLPHKWWRVQAAVQMGQDVKDGNSAGTATNRLHIEYFEPPPLLLKFKTTVNASTKDGDFHFMLEADVKLKPTFNGDPKDPRSRFKGYEGDDRLRYLEYGLKSKCAKISGVQAGQLNVWATAENFENPQITVVLNPFVAAPSETYVPIPGPDCPPGRSASGRGWLGVFLGIHGPTGDVGTLQGGAQGSEPQAGVIARETKQTQGGKVFFRKTYQRQNVVIDNDSKADENTEITLEVAP